LNKVISKLIIILLIVVNVLVIANISNFILNIILFIGKILLPFFLAFVLAYILAPIVKFFEKYLKKRKYAVFITILLIVIILFISIKSIYPFLSKEILKFVDDLPSIIEILKNKINKIENIFSFLPENYKPSLDNIIDALVGILSKVNIKTVDILKKIFSFITVIIITPVILIYMLNDFENIKEKVKNYLIINKKDKLKNYITDLHVFSYGYVKTTFIVMVIITLLSTITFIVMGLEYPLFFGIIIGITNVIPYIGPYIGGAFPVIYSITNPDINTLYILISIVCIQFIETNFISPYLHSKRSETHPLFVILSLSFFGSLFGVFGMLFAVPLLKFIEITLKYYPIKLTKK